jgi:hypothetical protein
VATWPPSAPGRYDHTASARALRERHGDQEWVGIVSGRIENARLDP